MKLPRLLLNVLTLSSSRKQKKKRLIVRINPIFPRKGEMDEEQGKIEWCEEVEQLLKQWGEESKGYAWMHRRCATWFNNWDIVLSIPNGFLAIALSITFFSTDLPRWVQFLMGGLQFLSGVLIFLVQYFEWGKRSARHEEAQVQFLAFADEIEAELKLPRHRRSSADRFYSRAVKVRRNLIKTAYPPIISMYLNQYGRKFKDKTFSKPTIADGITEITVTQRNTPDIFAGTSEVISKENANSAIQFEVDRFLRNEN